MFDQLFKRSSTRARHATAPFAEERARYLDYCELRGDSRSQQLRKAHDLLWIARKLNSYTELQVTSDRRRSMSSMAWRLAVLLVAFDTSITVHLALLLNPHYSCRAIRKSAANHDG